MSDKFNRFLEDFKDAWATELLQDRSEIRKNHLSYALSPNKSTVYIYVWNRQCTAARLEEDRCWIDSAQVNNLLRTILPEYAPYFQNQKNLIGMDIEHFSD